MKINFDIQAGTCGFLTRGTAVSNDSQHVTFRIESDCARITELARQLAGPGPLDAYDEIDGRTDSVLMRTARNVLTGCCAGCAVPVGLFKAMQVAAGLALPKDITIGLEVSNG
ncbi:MAG: hypothetical protein HN742_25380 [Lentisphaerae bacterium]|mgnify:FL=1|jgi:hypothetical protein|nr:hypothetical protein [Lentisphaerota bacterium]MBT4823390.1 hypothetical protein [Lentisphaerota bacterium]MBT5612253.1 hypothetical protein [Lentisphaerota bacterium]MBT7060769.1 hypothetical protein [Lentisphaerota bacterium]MBT7845232.1 hypothetical protein [Lentisphaerota bacterium]